MAAYRPVYGFGQMQADCIGPESALEPHIPFEYGLPYVYHCMQMYANYCS